MSKYTAPKKKFFILPNCVFDIPLDVYAFKVYAYLICCSGSRGECWPTIGTMSRKLGIATSTIQDRIDLLVKRKLIAVRKHGGVSKFKNNVYILLSQDNPDIYRDLSEPEALPL